MDAIKSNKGMIVVIGVALIGAIAYFYLKGGTSTSNSSLQAQTTGDTAVVAAQTLSLLTELNSLHIDTSLFTDPGYLSLRDNTVPIPTLPVGRDNPFAPVPGMPGATTDTPAPAKR